MRQVDAYDIIVSPVITEKATTVSEHNQVVFKVRPKATKPEIKKAVEQLFNVTVERVSTINVKGKVKRTTRGKTHAKNWKKAYVRVAQGQEIDFMVSG